MRVQSSSRIDDNLTDRSAEQNLQAIQNVSAQDPLAPHEVCLQPARVILALEPGPDLKGERCHRTASNTTYQALHARGWSQLKELTGRPGQDARIRPRIGNYSIQDNVRRSAGVSEFNCNQLARLHRDN